MILIGNPGVGKTALPIATGSKLCDEGGNVGFFNIPNLVIEMKKVMSLNQLDNYKKMFEMLDLVILDDLGYCSYVITALPTFFLLAVLLEIFCSGNTLMS